MTTNNRIDLAQDADTGIETLRAHFEGHAYDPHWRARYGEDPRLPLVA